VSTSISSGAVSSSLGVNQPGRSRNNVNGLAYQHNTTNGGGGPQRVMRQPENGYNYNSSNNFKANFATFNDEQARQLNPQLAN